MTKSELIERLAARHNMLSAKDAYASVECIIDSISSALQRGHRVEIRGFGSFALNYRPPRIGRNPKSGERVDVPEKWIPHFKAGKAMRDRVEAFQQAELTAQRKAA